MPDITRWSLSNRATRRGSPGRIMLYDATWWTYHLLSSTCCKMAATRSVVFNRISYPPLILAFCSSFHRYGPLHIYPCICSVAPCLRVLWMSTHGCFPTSFSLFPSYCDHMMESRSQRIPRMIPRGVQFRGVVRRSQAGGLAFSIVATFVLAFLRQTCLTYVCTQILLLPLTLVFSSLCIRALEAPGL